MEFLQWFMFPKDSSQVFLQENFVWNLQWITRGIFQNKILLGILPSSIAPCVLLKNISWICPDISLTILSGISDILARQPYPLILPKNTPKNPPKIYLEILRGTCLCITSCVHAKITRFILIFFSISFGFISSDSIKKYCEVHRLH